MANITTYPLFTVTHLRESKAFFTELFNFQVLFEASWVVMLAQADSSNIQLGLMSSDHPSQPPGPIAFNGEGAILTLQVDDVDALSSRVKAERVHPLTDEPWGNADSCCAIRRASSSTSFSKQRRSRAFGSSTFKNQ